MAEKKRDPAFTKLVINLQRSLETAGQSIRLLMKDVILPYWAHVAYSVLPLVHDGFFTFTFTFYNPQLDDDTGDLVIQMRCRTQDGRYIIPYSRTGDSPNGVVTRDTGEIRFNRQNLVFRCHDKGWLERCFVAPPPPWGHGMSGLNIYTFPDGYWDSTALNDGAMRQSRALAQYTQVISNFNTIYRRFDGIFKDMDGHRDKLKTHVIVPQEFRPQSSFFLQKPPNDKKRKRADDKAALESECAKRAAIGETQWFQESQREMRIKISRSDAVCDRLIKRLESRSENEDDASSPSNAI